MVSMALQRHIVKKPTKSNTVLEEPEWRWSSDALHWQRRLSTVPEIWVTDHPSLPVWFVESGGQVPDSVFLALWTQYSSVALMKRELFWWSLSDIEHRLQCLIEDMDESPDSIEEVGANQDSQMSLSNDGGYDPMRALLAAQESRPFNPQRQFETIEGGRFRAKH